MARKTADLPILTLGDAWLFKECHSDLIHSLESEFHVRFVTNSDKAAEILSKANTKVVLAADERIAAGFDEGPSPIPVQVVKGFLDRGGTILLCGLFSSMTGMDYIDNFFESLKSPWRHGSYYRTTLSKGVGAARIGDLPPAYSMKALLLKNVAPEDRVYAPNDASRVESFVFPPDKVSDLEETAIAFGKCGEGYIGYIGDVNGESETTPVILKMIQWALAQS